MNASMCVCVCVCVCEFLILGQARHRLAHSGFRSWHRIDAGRWPQNHCCTSGNGATCRTEHFFQVRYVAMLIMLLLLLLLLSILVPRSSADVQSGYIYTYTGAHTFLSRLACVYLCRHGVALDNSRCSMCRSLPSRAAEGAKYSSIATRFVLMRQVSMHWIDEGEEEDGRHRDAVFVYQSLECVCMWVRTWAVNTSSFRSFCTLHARTLNIPVP